MICKEVSLKFCGYQAAMISKQILNLVLVLACLLLSSSSTLIYAQPFHNSTTKLPTTWVNQPTFYADDKGTSPEIDSSFVGHTLTPILSRENTGPVDFICGFYCNGDRSFSGSRDCLFGVIMFPNPNHVVKNYPIQSPMLVWSANRNDPVQLNATLRLSEDGSLILRDWDGRLAWSSNTGGKSVAGMNLTENGNLVLFGRNNEPIWQSFDYPTDSLIRGQALRSGQRLIASVSASNRSEGLFYLSIDSAGLAAYANSNPPQMYFFSAIDNFIHDHGGMVVELGFGYDIGISLNNSMSVSETDRIIRLWPDGRLTVSELGWNSTQLIGWVEASDLIGSRACDYPMACGTYGVCSEGQCSCGETGGEGRFFTQTDALNPRHGCSLLRPISCHHSKYHTLLQLNNTFYFANFSSKNETFEDDCKNRCLNNCSCKAALFSTTAGVIQGSCLLLNQVFSIEDNENFVASNYSTTLYVKVQRPYPKASRRKMVIYVSSLSAILGVISVMVSCLVLFRKLNKKWKEARGDFVENVPGMPARYSYADLKAATGDFSEKLGEGGFGSVYGGLLGNGSKVAVKCLDGIAKVKDSFLVEVKTIGSIHHVNLVKLIGFCYEKSHRLLVYEYMSNRSLEGWIFDGKGNTCLPWDIRKRVILEIAKGLAYLHEECSQKIIHLDIKPQNILLDHNFNAKIGDFGLSKLIEKDQSRVITTMRGTPGYLAPEWLSSVITEKVDVYSFGVVVLEIICGRKNLDWSRAEEDKHLLSVFMRKAEEENLEELVDENSEDMQKNVKEAVEMMMIAAWCLQGDYTRRPSMSVVVKVLEGLVEAEANLEYDFLNRTIGTRGVAYVATELPASALSGPR